jgi:hypothetical protein
VFAALQQQSDGALPLAANKASSAATCASSFSADLLLPLGRDQVVHLHAGDLVQADHQRLAAAILHHRQRWWK